MADRNGVLKLQLVDVYEEVLGEKVDIRLRHQTLSHTAVLRDLDASKRIVIRDLHAVPQGLYRVEIDPPSYLPVSEFINVEEGPRGVERKIVFPVDPKKVVAVQFPEYGTLLEDGRRILEVSNGVLGFEGKRGPELYSALDDIRRAGLLNILAKSLRTRLSNDQTVISYVQQLSEIRGDRFFVHVRHELREETKNSVAEGIFEPVSGALHHPPDGFEPAGSYKTFDHYGNLQLSFFTNGTDWTADIDIDDARGLEHVFQVLRNELTGRPTHPYDIHEILIYHQDLDPGYRLLVRI